MEIFVKIYNGSLVRVFDTKKNKKKEVVLTPVQDNQKEAEVEFYSKNKKIETLLFKNLPPAKARVLNLPVSIELINKDKLKIQYKGENKEIEKHELNFKDELENLENKQDVYKENKKNFKKFYYILIPLVLFVFIILFLFFIFNKKDFLISKNDKKDNDLKIENKNDINKIEQFDKNKEIIKTDNDKKEQVIENENKIIEKKFSKETLADLINQNSPLFFIMDKSILLSGEEAKLNKIIDYLKNYNKIEIMIYGHTENINQSENEMKLSIERAEYIKNAIILKYKNNDFIINIKGYGAAKPLYPEANENLKFKNRRVEILVNSAEGRE